MIGVADEAVVGEHDVIADLDQLDGGEHRVAVEEAAFADPHPRVGGERQPAAGLEQGAGADGKPPGVERLQHLSLDRIADEESRLGRVTIEPQAAAPAAVALVPAPLHPPGAPLRQRRHGWSFANAGVMTIVLSVSPGSDQARRGGIDLGGTKIQTVVVDGDNEVLGRARHPTPTSGGPEDVAKEMVAAMLEATEQ